MNTQTSTTPLIKIRNLSIWRNGKQIVKNIDWTVQQNEHWTILGSNGCGKTSLLSAITAYLSPSEGTIEFSGQRYGTTDWTAVRNQIGIVSSALSRRIPQSETAIEVVLSGELSQLGFWTRDDQINAPKALACLKKMGASELAERRWEILSQGERQKVFIARALMADPQLLILDEPCAGLDPVARERFLDNLSLLAQTHNSPGLILVTHHVEEILPELSHILILKEGSVLASGEKVKTLTSHNLSKAFGAKVKLGQIGTGRWQLEIEKI